MKNKFGGWLLLDKPEGISSASALVPVKKLLRKSSILAKVGHAGTLDPFASGLLVVGLGSATRLMEYAFNCDKVYDFTIKWGEETDTADKTGKVLDSSLRRPTPDEIKSTISSFVGPIEQVPPIFSAIKINGRRAYEMARNNEEFTISSRKVLVHSLKLVDFSDDTASLRLRCSKGLYVRSLARDMARAMGCYGHVSYLRRLSIGDFSVDQSYEIGYIESASSFNSDFRILPINSVLGGNCISGDLLSFDSVKALAMGKSINASEFALNQCLVDDREVALLYDGELIALCRLKDSLAHPFKVFV